MTQLYTCQRCMFVNQWAHYGPTVACRWTCHHCGTPHSLPAGEALGPAVLPLMSTRRLSPWVSGRYRPLAVGFYHVRFRGVPVTLTLRWSGAHWTWGLVRVITTVLTDWRGTWGNSEKTVSPDRLLDMSADKGSV